MSFPNGLTPPTLAEWEFSYNGIVLGSTDQANGTGTLSVEGLGDLAQIRSGDAAMARENGEFIGLDLYGGRDITMNVWAITDGVSLQDTLQNIAAATVVGYTTEQPLWFQLPNMPILAVMCRPRKRSVPFDLLYANVMIGKPVIQFHATDPLVYAQAQYVTVGLG